jgi:hypothetical protein
MSGTGIQMRKNRRLMTCCELGNQIELPSTFFTEERRAEEEDVGLNPSHKVPL